MAELPADQRAQALTLPAPNQEAHTLPRAHRHGPGKDLV